jgi:hypothetical protein
MSTTHDDNELPAQHDADALHSAGPEGDAVPAVRPGTDADDIYDMDPERWDGLS